MVDDIDGHFHRATAAGAVIGTPLEDARWGYRHYEAVDPEGHGWHFMKPLQDLRQGKPAPEGLELRLVYTDERAALEFLTGAFGFREQARLDNPDGSIMAWLGFGDGFVMIGRADAAQRQHSPSETAKPTAMLNLHVDEINAHYQRTVSQGARIVTELDDTFWGYRRYEAVDSERNRWHIMQKLTHQAAIRVESIYSRKSIIDGRLVQLENARSRHIALQLSSRTLVEARADGDTLDLGTGISGEKFVNGKPKDSGDDRPRDPQQVEQGGEGDPQIEPESMVVQVVDVVPQLGLHAHEGSYRVPGESGPTRSVRVEPAGGRDTRGSNARAGQRSPAARDGDRSGSFRHAPR